jgi:nucleotide-binding universal stress UspA family protein
MPAHQTASAIRSIFVAASATPDGEVPSSARYAISMARQLGAHLTLRMMAVHINAPFTLAPGFVRSLSGRANADERARAEKALAAARELLAGAAIAPDVAMIEGDFAELLTRTTNHSRVSDISLCGSSGASLVLGRAFLEDLIFNSGRPVIVVPDDTHIFASRHMLIAWDGTNRAARAVHDALPLLQMAETIDIATVTNEKNLADSTSAADLVQALARHAIHAKLTSMAPLDQNAGKALMDHAAANKTDLVIMGAFARSWLKQIILGGVTNAMLETSPIPLFMSH